MAKTKKELLEEAKKAGIEATEKNTIAEIQDALKNAGKSEDKKEVNPNAKAGKRSAKGLAEAEEKQEKIERQKSAETETAEEEKAAKPKKIIKPARSRLERRAKGYRKSAELIDKKKTYSVKEALDLATKTSHVKFDATVELHVRLNVDPKQADQNIRDSVVLPAGSGKTLKIAVFAEEDDAKKAKSAGADIAGDDTILALLEKGQIDFDILIATPNLMAKLAKHARVLGPKGLMPNPKSGTVTKDVQKAVTQAKAGKVEYRVDSTGNVHVGIGKVSFGREKLNDNARAVLDSIKQNKPGTLKSVYVQNISVTTSMGPSIKVLTSEL
jgi:ribosomal protein L1